MFTLFIVRRRWADAVNQVDISVDDVGPVTTVPQSFIQARLASGRHQLALSWEGAQAVLEVEGVAGEVRFVELAGSTWFWGSRYRWVANDQEGARARARASRLIAVMDLAH
ncbi:hypothetical protein HHL10_19045 [Azohydromonas sp. G-1-1-14]|uniref:Uncharacterized protein n=1 Tax=Azohydromonas caseinilytica TaxID=2728836 RepID=A0A848FFJ3_9BURK|nr:hypothetical protein [Azohydromonas caseinilytica]